MILPAGPEVYVIIPSGWLWASLANTFMHKLAPRYP